MDMNSDLQLEGRRAVITGASRGIGKAIAERLAHNGARVALVSRKRETLEEVASELTSRGTETLVIPANMNRSEDVVAIIPQVVERWGGVDILVNNAATNPVFGPLVDLNEEAWDKVMKTNVSGPFLLSREAAREMMKAGTGVIINIASTGGLEPSPMLGAYSVSKAAVIMLTKVMAAELGKSGIRVNTLVPGWIMTERQLTNWIGDAENKLIDENQALAGRCYPADIARMAMFLAADDSKMISAQDFIVDGGWAHG